MPVTAAPMRVPGTLDAGIHAYESRDYARAYRIWRPLAENGEANAQFHLGALYLEGRGVDRNLAEARRWLRAALAQGQERARFLLGRVEDGIAKAG
jgi:TPR repeat protein